MVDYVQLIKSSARSFSRREELADICQEIQIFAKDTGVTMFILAQLNRDIKNGDGKPALIHFKDTGQIEQSADIAILLSKINDDPRRMLADFAKVRFGRTEEVYLDVEPETLTYKEGSKPETQPQSNRNFDDFDDKMWK
jgi:replicative DNA helicase